MSEPSSTPSPPSTTPAQRGNAAAIASFICGLLGCIPEITGLLAIGFGIAGMRRARRYNIGGRGWAAVGIALGIVNIILWSGAISFFVFIIRGSEPARLVARQYIADLSNQEVAAVMAASTPSIRRDQVESLSARMHSLGRLVDVQVTGAYFGIFNGQTEWKLNGRALYSRGPCFFTITVVHSGDGWKVREFWINPQGAGQFGVSSPQGLAGT